MNAYVRSTPLSKHQPRSWSKAEAPSNIANIVVTPEVSHVPMSPLKDEASSNKRDMSITPPVSHVEMWPYVVSAALASENHAATAVLMLLSVMT